MFEHPGPDVPPGATDQSLTPDNGPVPALSLLALAVATSTAVVIYLDARRFSRRYIELHRRVPPPSWMFRRQDDPALEAPRRQALALLPILIVTAIVYVVSS
jgi:hypothetical protein